MEYINTVEEAIQYINRVGFLPLFRNEIPGFSLEEHTKTENWWSENPKVDPWIWRELIAQGGTIAYGKFFDKKAGFISMEWLPVFANYRRDGYDFDALYEDGKAPMKHKKIMDNFMENNADVELLSNELKRIAGLDKGFDGAVTNLMMQIYLCNCNFVKRKNKKGEEYGWKVAIYATPEHLWGYDTVTASYKEKPCDSWEKIVNHMYKLFPDITDKQIRKVLK